jgi:hypothetical protein
VGPSTHQKLTTHYVALSLTLFALGSSDLTDRFHLRTLSICRPSAIMGPMLDTFVVSLDAEGASCEELGWHVNSRLLHPFITPARARCVASSVVAPQGYKAGGHLYVQPTSSRKTSHHLLASFPTTKKKER